MPLLFFLVMGRAAAHDTWLTLVDDSAPGLLTFALSTGKHFPLQESGHPLDGVVQSGCVDEAGRKALLRPREVLPHALLLRVRTLGDTRAAMACWAATRSRSVELSAAEVATYLDEIQAPQEIRDRWDAQTRQGVPWREIYAKHARLERPGPSPLSAPALAVLRAPVRHGLEILPLPSVAAQPGGTLRFQVLADGNPVPGLAVQLVSERLPLGIWRRTDGLGQVAYVFPFGGRWLLRATRLQPPGNGGVEWRSFFSTLVLDLDRRVAP